MLNEVDTVELICEACSYKKQFDTIEERDEALKGRGTKCPSCGDDGEYADNHTAR